MPCNDNFQDNLVAAVNSVVITSKRGNNRFPLFIYLFTLPQWPASMRGPHGIPSIVRGDGGHHGNRYQSS